MMEEFLDDFTYNIYDIYRFTYKFYAREMKKIGVTMGQFSFLLGIHSEPGITQERLSSKLQISKSTTAQIVKQLLDESLIRRITDESDKRNYNLFLTEKGENVIPSIREKIGDCHAILTEGLTASEKNVLTELLIKVRLKCRQKNGRKK